MDQNLNREKVEEAIRECNRVLNKWYNENKHYLINEHEIKGTIFNRLKGYCGVWREQKIFLKMLRVYIVDGQIKAINLIDIGNSYQYRLANLLDTIFDQLDYESLKCSYRADSEVKQIESKSLNIDFKTIEQIKF